MKDKDKEKDVVYEPKPVDVQADGKKLYIIEDIKIWAYSYAEALQLLPYIKSF